MHRIGCDSALDIKWSKDIKCCNESLIILCEASVKLFTPASSSTGASTILFGFYKAVDWAPVGYNFAVVETNMVSICSRKSAESSEKMEFEKQKIFDDFDKGGIGMNCNYLLVFSCIIFLFYRRYDKFCELVQSYGNRRRVLGRRI